ncbi:aspartyl/glutamyl-tRNA amidotransferase subunit C [Candidatus Nomurabacteria bacterium]|nr:aspartyl/glutamyl-tRNA amidotransferase subunit C [Candidatus Nomurabacteria bacterium]
MITNDEVRNLANLARIGLTPEEETKLTSELGQILNYVGELGAAVGETVNDLGENKNNLREDGEPLPALEKGEFVKVKKIL